MYLICGLGNPGNKYVKTRHNVGFKLIDNIFNKYNFKLIKKNKNKELYRGKIANNNCLLIKPQSFMNLSGDVVSDILKFYKIKSSNLYVIHDDLDLGISKVKVKNGGGNGGHNGLKSIDDNIGKNYFRIRIGIGHPGEKKLVSKYVLSNFLKEEKEIIYQKLEIITKNFNLVFKDSSLFLTKIAEEQKNYGV